MSDRLEDLGVPPKLLAAIRNEVRSNIEHQLNDLWMVVHSLKNDARAAGAGEGSGPAVEPAALEELKKQVSDLTSEVHKRIRALKKQLEADRSTALPADLDDRLQKLESGLERIDKVERDTGQLGGAAALFENRLVDQESRLLRRLEEAEARLANRPTASGGTAAPALDELSTEHLLSLSGSVEFSLADLAKVAIKYNASDLVVRPNSLPYTYLEGDLIPIGQKMLTAIDAYRVAMLALQPNERRQLCEQRSYSKLVEYHSARFLLNAYYERGELAVYARRLVPPRLTLDHLDLPRAVEVSLLEERGLILLCGLPTNGLRELAYALLQPINQQRRARIFTVEDAISFHLKEEQSLLSQLQMGQDVSNIGAVVRLRPDVLYLQSITQPADLQTAIQLSNENTLVLAGCEGPSVVQALQNLVESVAAEQRPGILQQLGGCLRSVLCYRQPQPSEYLINSAKVRPWLERGDYAGLQTAVEAGQAGQTRVAEAPAPARESEPLPPPSVEMQAHRPVAPNIQPPSTTKPTAPAPEAEGSENNGGDEETLLGWL